jgi:hypothetical protein
MKGGGEEARSRKNKKSRSQRHKDEEARSAGGRLRRGAEKTRSPGVNDAKTRRQGVEEARS